MKKLFFIVAVFALVSCGTKVTDNDEKNTFEVKVHRVSTRLCQVPFHCPAQLRGKQDIAILPQVSALLKDVLVSEGQEVKKGQRLFILDDTEYRAAYENAQALVKKALAQEQTAQLEVEAKKELFLKNIISEHEYKVAQNTLLSVRATVAEAKAAERSALNNLNHCVIVAPSDGVVGNINHRQGALVGPQLQEPLTIVSDNHIIYAYISISEQEYQNLMCEAGGSKEQLIARIPECELILGNGTLYELKGHVETMSGVIDPNTGALSVRVAFDNPNGILTAGGSATVQIMMKYEGLVIPRAATYEIQDKTYAYVVNSSDSTAYSVESTIVSTYRLNDTEYIVFEGLKAGDIIAVEGIRKLQNNMSIVPIWAQDTVNINNTDSIQ